LEQKTSDLLASFVWLTAKSSSLIKEMQDFARQMKEAA